MQNCSVAVEVFINYKWQSGEVASIGTSNSIELFTKAKYWMWNWLVLSWDILYSKAHEDIRPAERQHEKNKKIK